MKRLLCFLVAAVLTISSAAFAETAGQQSQMTPAQTVEERLYRMIPVFDSLARNVGAAGEFAYDPSSQQFFWTQLSLLGANWGYTNPQVKQEASELVIPASVMQAWAAASFGVGAQGLPAIPQDITSIRFDAASNTYRIPMSGLSPTYIIIERYATASDSVLQVGIGVYDTATGARKSGFLVQLEESAPADSSPDASFPFTVTAARVESSQDFAGLAVTNSRIQYVPPMADTATPAPTATLAPASQEYSKLSSGSRGDDVRELQARLKELGYPVGSVDGTFGYNTKLAVRYFQDAIDVYQDGVASSSLQRKLYASGAPKYVKYVSLKTGASGVRVEKLQSRLRELGYLAQPRDGDFGSRTKEAVLLFQKTADLKEDGIAGTRTLRALYDKDAPECDVYITLKKGDTGIRVEQMQKRLYKLGFLTKKNITKRYDTNTVKAMKAFIVKIGEKGNGGTASVTLLKKLFKYTPPTPTPKPTSEPTPKPTSEPTPKPTATPKPAPVQAITDAQLTTFTTDLNTILGTAYNAADAVKWLQEKLSIPQNGIYDSVTYDAVTQYQTDQGLTVTGIPDKDTINKLLP